MKSFFKYVSLCAFAAASLGVVACNNNTRALKAPTVADEPLLPIIGTEKQPVELQIVDSANPDDTITVSGFMSVAGPDTVYLTTSDATKNVYVSRVATPSGLINFGFYYKRLRSDGIPSIYMSHQNQGDVLFKISQELPIEFNSMVNQFDMSREELMLSVAQYLANTDPFFVAPNAMNPSGGDTLPSNIVQEWAESLRTQENAQTLEDM